MPEVDLDFLDPRLSMNYWWPRIADLDIPAPETALVPLEDVMSEDDVALQPIIDGCRSLDSDRYFLRGDKKSARVLEEGSFLNSTDEAAVRFVMENLMASVLMSDRPTNSVAVRERLELDDWVHSYGKPVAPEVRVFIDNGDVLCYHLRVDESDLSPYALRETDEVQSDEADLKMPSEQEIEELSEQLVSEGDDGSDDADADAARISAVLTGMAELIDEEWDEKIRPHAERVATEFSDSGWSVDFLRGADGTWYQTDMALYGLYYNELTGNGWTSLSAHPKDCEYNLEEHPPESLPENPKNALTERAIDVP